MELRVMVWNTRGQCVPPSVALDIAVHAQAQIFCVLEPSGAFVRSGHDAFAKVQLIGPRAIYVFHDPALGLVWSRTPGSFGNSGEACCVKFQHGNDALTIGFCHAQFAAGRNDGSGTADWMASFENWLRMLQADLYMGDTNMGRPGAVASRMPRAVSGTQILGDRGTTDAGNPYDKGKLLNQRVHVEVAGLVKPGSRRPAPAQGDLDDDKDPDGNLYVPMPQHIETQYWQSDHRPIYADIAVMGGG